VNGGRLLQQTFALTLAVLLFAACGGASTEPTATPTETPIPGGIISGRIYLMDRDEPVRTTVSLMRGLEQVDSTATDEDGRYSFSVEEPGAYGIQVSVMDLLDICDNLRVESGRWIQTARYGESGVVDVCANSLPMMNITIGDEITLDCELHCD
jgi:hypothetical protein